MGIWELDGEGKRGSYCFTFGVTLCETYAPVCGHLEKAGCSCLSGHEEQKPGGVPAFHKYFEANFLLLIRHLTPALEVPDTSNS